MLHISKKIFLAILLGLITALFIAVTFFNPSFLSPLFFFADLSNTLTLPPLASESAQEASASTPSIKPLPIDYAELIRCAKTYNNQWVQIAGRIGYTENKTLYIFDRVNYYVAEEGNHTSAFKIYLNSDSNFSYVPGDYCTVEGLWNYGFDEPYLSKAVVTSSGETAKVLALEYQKNWETERAELAETVPLTDYLVLNEQAEQLSGSYVRTAATIGHVNGLTIAGRPNYSLNINSERTGELLGTISLDGCTPEVQALCQEGISIIVGGYLHEGPNTFYLENCYIETVGEPAQEEVESFINQHKLNYKQQKQVYISKCLPLDYDAILRHPNDFQTAQLTCAGTVDEISDGDPLRASFVIRLDSQPERRVDVSYSHGAIGDANIILGSSIVVYGSVFDVYYPEDANGAKKESLPMFIAKYADY